MAHWGRPWIALCAAVLAASPAIAQPRIDIVGLYDGKAVARIDGHLHTLTVGQTGPAGVTLIESSSDGATLEYDGVQRRYSLHEGQWGPISIPKTPEPLVLHPNDRGLYTVDGMINGKSVSMVVDTGANAVAMSVLIAQQLGIDYRLGREVSVTTAGRHTRGWELPLDTVSVGRFVQNQVTAVVVEEGGAPDVLLGLSFLKALRLRHEGDTLYLESRSP